MKGKQSIMKSLLQAASLPFKDRVIRFSLLEKLQVSHIDMYDGSNNFVKHIKTYRVHITLYGIPDEITCMPFPITLKGPIGRGLDVDPSYALIFYQFLTQFIVGQRRRKQVAYLLTLKQRENESLKVYMIHFEQEKLKIDKPKESIVLVTLLKGVRPHESFMEDLAQRTPSSLKKFIDKAKDFMNANDTIKALTMPNQKEENC